MSESDEDYGDLLRSPTVPRLTIEPLNFTALQASLLPLSPSPRAWILPVKPEPLHICEDNLALYGYLMGSLTYRGPSFWTDGSHHPPMLLSQSTALLTQRSRGGCPRMPLSALGKTNGVYCQSACTGAGSSRKPRAHMWLHPPFSPQCLLPNVAQWPGAALRDRSQKAEMLCQPPYRRARPHTALWTDDELPVGFFHQILFVFHEGRHEDPIPLFLDEQSTRPTCHPRRVFMRRVTDTPHDMEQILHLVCRHTTLSTYTPYPFEPRCARSIWSSLRSRLWPHTSHTPYELDCGYDSPLHAAASPKFSSPANQDVPAPQPASPCIRIAALFLFLSGAPEHMYRLVVVTQHQHAEAKPRLHAYLEEYPR